jgi:hypothetical protein
MKLLKLYRCQSGVSLTMIDSGVLKDFEWYRDKKGYHLSLDPPFRSLGEREGRPVIVANGGHSELISYRPFARGGDLCTPFSLVKTAKELLRFVNDHGPLTARFFPLSPPNDVATKMRKFFSSGESVGEGLGNAKMFDDFLRLKAEGNTRKLASYFESDKHPPNRYRNLMGRVELVADSSIGLRLRLRPPDLLGALWYQLGLKLSKTTLRTCPVCDKVFEVGAGTSLRADARFCCPEHKVEYFNRKRPRATQKFKMSKR